jgi:hypothetical protein
LPEAPLVAGVALALCGVLLMQLNPDLLAMPKRRPAKQSAIRRFRGGDQVGALAQQARDVLIQVLPKNLLGGIGRGLVFAGVGILAVRLLDMLAGDESAR